MIAKSYAKKTGRFPFSTDFLRLERQISFIFPTNKTSLKNDFPNRFFFPKQTLGKYTNPYLTSTSLPRHEGCFTLRIDQFALGQTAEIDWRFTAGTKELATQIWWNFRVGKLTEKVSRWKWWSMEGGGKSEESWGKWLESDTPLFCYIDWPLPPFCNLFDFPQVFSTLTSLSLEVQMQKAFRSAKNDHARCFKNAKMDQNGYYDYAP